MSRYLGFSPKDHRTVEEPLLYFLRQLFRQLRIEATGLEHHELIGFFSLLRESKIIQNCLVSMGKPRKPKGKWDTHILGTRHMSKTHLCLAILGWTWTAWYQSFDLLSGTCGHWAAWGGAKHHSSKGATQLGKDPDISPMFCNRHRRPINSLNNYWKVDSTFSTWFSHVQKPFPHIPIVFM